jgi:RHS repeat-associated protein
LDVDIVTFKYDPFGRRIYKSSSSATSIYAYDGDNLVEETNASGTAVARYSQGLNIDEPLAMLRSGGTSFYNLDGLGSVTSLSNAGGALAQTYTYDSFGNQTASSGSLTNPLQYTSRELDSETGLYFYRARYFDPTSGRFLGEDSVHNYLFKSFYSYVFNSPINATDPTGKRTRVCCRPVGNWVAGSALGKSHCSIAIDGNPGINGGGLGTFSLFPANYSALGDTGIGVPHSNDPTDVGPIQNGTATCTDVPDCTSCKEKKILENQGYGGDPGPSYNYHTTYRGFQNSNTYVSYALKKAGCTPPKLPSGISAPGY